MKLVVCGKGGCGKSTIVALLAKQYAQAGRRVLVVDTDESNAGLHRMLGTDAPKDLMEFVGGKKKMMEDFRKARDCSSTSILENARTIDSIHADFISGNDGIRLVAVGKIHQAGEGCACPMGALAKQFIAELQISANDIVLIDTEAGIEHFGRGIDKVCNVILMVIDPSYESLRMAQKVSDMAATIGVPLYYVLNKTDPITAQTLRNTILDRSRIIGEFSQDSGILAAGLEGRQMPADYPPVTEVMKTLSMLG